MPSRLTNAPTIFMDLMNRVYKPILGKYVIVFIDDILVYSKSLADHLTHVVETLWQIKLYVKFSKCEFWLDIAAFLGHIVTSEGISVDPSKIEAIMGWNRLINVSEVLIFLGLTGYYRRFVKDFSKIAVPLTRLT